MRWASATPPTPTDSTSSASCAGHGPTFGAWLPALAERVPTHRSPRSARLTSGSSLLLVPANRPADVLSVLGGLIATEVMSDAELTAVARSWEERFGTVVVGIGAGVARPGRRIAAG